MKLEKWAQVAVGIYITLPGIEDVASGGTTLVPSIGVGLAIVANAFGVRLW